jgi:hypothetical protein
MYANNPAVSTRPEICGPDRSCGLLSKSRIKSAAAGSASSSSLLAGNVAANFVGFRPFRRFPASRRAAIKDTEGVGVMDSELAHPSTSAQERAPE